VDKDQPVWSVTTLTRYLDRAFAPTRFVLFLLGAFAALAVTLAAIGIYGVLSYAVAQRRQEIGVRMALGARAGAVVGLVVRQGMSLTLIAVVLGLLAAFGVSRLMRTLLFGISPADPLTFAACAVVLGAVAFAACYLPARRAARIDPVRTLAHE
jgi:putative ABC transport system permease protein